MNNANVCETLAVDQLMLAFGGNTVLQDISLNFVSGKVIGLIGPNGAGKTSFFNCLTGLYQPQKGTIRLGGKDLTNTKPYERAALGFSRSFQHVVLCNELTIIENVMVGLNLYSKSGWFNAFLPFSSGKKERSGNAEVAMSTLKRLGIEAYAEKFPTELPPGMLRLAEIARAIVGSPKVMLLDEPAAGLNSIETRDLSKTIKSLRSKDLIIIVVEHDMDLVMDVCEEIHVLSVGKILASGTPEQIQNNNEVIEVYLGGEV